MIMKLLILLCLLPLVYCGEHPNLIGEFEAKDGAFCKVLKLDMGAGNHAAAIECSCNNSAGKAKAYSCSYYYSGDFDTCIPEKVHQETISDLKEESSEKHGGCSASIVPISYNSCPGGGVDLTRQYYNKNGSPCKPRDELSGVYKLNQQVGEVKGIVRDNIGKVVERGDRIDRLDEKADNVRAAATHFDKTSTRLKKKKQRTGWKLWCILISVISVIVLVVLVLVVGVPVGYCLTGTPDNPRC